MTELVIPDGNTWTEVVDLNETDPLLQNKKLKTLSSDPTRHTQGTDQYLDEGGVFEVAVSTAYVSALARSPFLYIETATMPATQGECRIGTSSGGQRIIRMMPTVFSGEDYAEIWENIAPNTYIYIASKSNYAMVKAPTAFSIVDVYLQETCDVIAEGSADAFVSGELVTFNIISG